MPITGRHSSLCYLTHTGEGRTTPRGSTTTTSTYRKGTMTTTENIADAVIEGEVVASTEGPATDASGENASSGVVANVPEPETSELNEKQARTLTEKIKKGLTGAADTHDKLNTQVATAAELMSEAFAKRIWLALGETSWEDFVAQELGEVRYRLERTVRQSLVYQLTTGPAHMSTRAIAPVLGVDQKTVSNDLRQVRKELNVAPAPVVGQDGKTYAAAPEVPTPRPRRAKPIEDRFTAAIEAADKFVGDLVTLSVEEGWEQVVGAVAKTHRADIARLLDSLKGVQDRLSGN